MPITLNLNVNVTHHRAPCAAEGDPLMQALVNLITGIDRLTAAVDRLANNGGVGGGGTVPEADVQAQADRVIEQAQRLEAMPTPNDPTP